MLPILDKKWRLSRTDGGSSGSSVKINTLKHGKILYCGVADYVDDAVSLNTPLPFSPSKVLSPYLIKKNYPRVNTLIVTVVVMVVVVRDG